MTVFWPDLNLLSVIHWFNRYKSDRLILNVVVEINNEDVITLRFRTRYGSYVTILGLLKKYKPTNFKELFDLHGKNPILQYYWNYQGDLYDLISFDEDTANATHQPITSEVEIYDNVKEFLEETKNSEEAQTIMSREKKTHTAQLMFKLTQFHPADPNFCKVELRYNEDEGDEQEVTEKSI